VETAPFERLHLRQPAFEDERTRATLQSAQDEAAVLNNAEATLGKEFDLSLGGGTHTPLNCSNAPQSSAGLPF